MLKITVLKNSQVKEFDNVFDALRHAKALRAEDVEDSAVEIYCHVGQIFSLSNNLVRTDLAASSTYAALYDRMLEEQYEYACSLKGIKPIDC